MKIQTFFIYTLLTSLLVSCSKESHEAHKTEGGTAKKIILKDAQNIRIEQSYQVGLEKFKIA